MKKFELITDSKVVFGKTLFRIKALVSFGDVSVGDLGGFVEKEECLSHDGDAWVYGDAQVYGNALVSGNAWVYGNAQVYGDAWVYGDARVSGDARVYGDARVLWFSKVGSSLGTLTAFVNKDGGITVTRGCFIGTLDEFRAAVKKTHGRTEQAKAYAQIADYIEFHFTKLHPIKEINK